MKYIIPFFVFACCSLFFAQRSEAQCYVRLEDASGFNTDAYQDTLQAAAANLCAIFDSTGFAGQFKVYDFGFYLHQENTTGGYPEPFAKKIGEVQDSSPYYLLFGKQTDKSGVYTKFWVDLVLPDTGKFECLDLLSAGFRNNLTEKTKIIANTIHSNNNQYDEYDKAEIGSMDTLRNILNRIFNCCGPTNRPSSCSACLYTPNDIYDLFTKSGFSKIPVKITSMKREENDSIVLFDSLFSSRMLILFEDLSNLKFNYGEDLFDLDNDITALLSSLPSPIKAKAVYTDNDAFCNFDVIPYFADSQSKQFGVYFWAHVWKDPGLVQDYLFFQINFEDNGVKKNLAFNGYAPIDAGINQPINTSDVETTISTIYAKNGYEISVQCADTDTLDWDELYNVIKLHPSGFILPGPGHSHPIANTNGFYGKNNNVIDFRYFIDTEQPQQPKQREYVLGFVLAHEFLHQILTKSYYYIFPKRPPSYPETLIFPNGSHVNIEKNILMEGAEISNHKDTWVAPNDKNLSILKLTDVFYFSGRYVPAKNNLDKTSEWERIVKSNKRLINNCWMLRNLESAIGGNSPSFIHISIIASKQNNFRDYDFSMP